MAAAKKSAGKKKATAKKAVAQKVAAKKSAPVTKKVAVKKVSAKKPPANKPPAKKAAAKKTAVKPAPATKKAKPKMPAENKPVAAKKAAPDNTAAVPKTAAAKKKSATKSSSFRSSLLSNDVPEVHEVPPPRGTTKDGIAYTKDFDVKFLKVQREELIARKASEIRRATRLEDEAESLIENGEMGDVQFDDEGGEGDTMVVQRDLDRLLSSQAREAVAEIDLALARIEAGIYGYSAVSGLPIPRERLEALPETTVLAAEKVSGAGLR
jgi:RNA polymerase-binding transcription factor DksA